MKNNNKKESSKLEDDDNDNDNNDNNEIFLENNHIYYYCDVNNKNILKLVKLIKLAEENCILIKHRYNLETINIFLHINSNGGYTSDAKIAIDYIENCKIPIHTIIEGDVASSGILISVVGKKRYMLNNGSVLIHQPTTEFSGKFNEFYDKHTNLQNLSKQLKNIYLSKTFIKKKKLKKMLTSEIWLNANECLELGIVDEIWK